MPPETAPPTAATSAQPDPATSAAPAAPTSLLTADPAASATPSVDPAAAKPAEGTPPADAKPADDKPVEYADFQAPEGVTLNAEALTELKAFAAEKKLSQEDAQKLVDLGAKTIAQQQAALTTQIEQAQAQWAEASRTDKEFGGDALDANLSVAKKALDTFGSPELSKLLAESGLGNHPDVIRAFYRVGKAISEDKLVTGSTKPATAENDLAKKMYPTMNN